jgi:MFS family permease
MPDSDPAPSAPASERVNASLTALLSERAYLWLWTGRTFCSFGTLIQSIALGWQVYAVARLTGTVNQAAFALGVLGLAQFLPMAALSLVGGDAADRYDRRLLIGLSVTVMLGTAVALTVMALMGVTQLWPIYLVGAVFGAARAFYMPAGMALSPSLVRPELVPRSIVFNSISNQLAAISGPAVGGLLVAVSPVLAFSTAMALFVISLATLTGFRGPPLDTAPKASRLTLIGEGLHYVWTNKIILGAISLDLFAVLLGGATALLPVFARDVLHVGAQGYGVLRAAPSVGALLIGLRLATHPVKSQVGLKMFLGVAVFGLSTVVFALSRSLALSAVALACLGAGDMVSVFVRQTLVQIMTPNAMRGRVAAVLTLFIGASNELGEFESGMIARLVGPVGSALFGGFGALAVTGLWAWLFPALRKADKLS